MTLVADVFLRTTQFTFAKTESPPAKEVTPTAVAKAVTSIVTAVVPENVMHKAPFFPYPPIRVPKLSRFALFGEIDVKARSHITRSMDVPGVVCKVSGHPGTTRRRSVAGLHSLIRSENQDARRRNYRRSAQKRAAAGE